jgi:hypothetical protein
MPAKRGAKRPIHLPALATRKRRARKNPSSDGFISNAKDAVIANGLVHAAGGYASARLAGRIARRMLAAKFPALGRHATPLGNVAMAAVIYMVTKKWRKVREEAVIGAVIAVIQSILQAYMPGLAAMLMDTDASLELAGAKAAAGLDAAPQAMRKPGLRKKFVLPGEIEAGRAEEARASSNGPVKYVMPGSPGSGYGAPSVGDDFEDATANIPDTAGDLEGDDDLGIFNQ